MSSKAHCRTVDRAGCWRPRSRSGPALRPCRGRRQPAWILPGAPTSVLPPVPNVLAPALEVPFPAPVPRVAVHLSFGRRSCCICLESCRYYDTIQLGVVITTVTLNTCPQWPQEAQRRAVREPRCSIYSSSDSASSEHDGSDPLWFRNGGMLGMPELFLQKGVSAGTWHSGPLACGYPLVE